MANDSETKVEKAKSAKVEASCVVLNEDKAEVLLSYADLIDDV